jgi:hypothetical protein
MPRQKIVPGGALLEARQSGRAVDERGTQVAHSGNLLIGFKRFFGLVLPQLAALTVACALTRGALAQSQPATIDTSLGPITGSTRYIGLGGAFVAIADDTEGVAINPASSAVRLPYSWHEWDYGLGLDVSIGAWLPKNDIYNSGKGDVKNSTALFGSLGAIIYYQNAGFGLAAEAQHNAATAQNRAQGITPDKLTADFGMVHASLAYGYLDGQLLLGAGPRFIGTSLGGGSGLFSAAGVGYEAGVILKPHVAQYRAALAVKSPVNAKIPGGGASTAHVPWEVALGFAYQFGPRPLNPPLVTAKDLAREIAGDPERDPTPSELEDAERQLFDRYQRLQRWYLLVSAELAAVEAGIGALGVQQALTAGLSGKNRPVLSPRLGLESEVIPHILRLRAGSYFEPPRTTDATGRIHGTGGLDVRLFEWSVFGLHKPFDWWSLSLGADAARAYLNTSFSIGFWH